MSGAGWAEVVLLIVLLALSTPLLGNYLAGIFGDRGSVASSKRRSPGDRVFLPIENLIYRICGIDPDGEQRWTTYAYSLLVFSLVGALLLYAVLRLQAHLPFNPDHQKAMTPGLSFNTAISFLTNTNWQNYAGESTLSHLAQMFGLVLQQFLSAAVGITVVIALIRGLTRQRRSTLGSFWVDVTRAVTRVLLPLSILFAVIFMSQGVIENFNASTTTTSVAAQATQAKGKNLTLLQQQIPGGPVASQTAIEILGNNGGGFYNANLAHPYENPNAITNILQVWLLLMLPFAFPWAYGRMVRSRGQGLVILASMVILWIVPALAVYTLEAGGNTQLHRYHVSQTATASQGGGNMEGKDTRIGVVGSALNAASITPTSTGSVNSAHESYVPLSGGLLLVNILFGEVSPGGVGAGLYGKLILAILSVFIAGLMVGRTPEYLGKKIQAAEMKLVTLYIIAVPLVILVFSAISIVSGFALKSVSTTGAHGLTELVYAYASVSNNNGSAMAGLAGNTQWYNTTFGICMFIGRYFLMIPVLAIAGSLVRKRIVPMTSGTFETDKPIFVGLLLAVTVILVGLTYFPIVALGPIVEHLAGHF